MYIVSGATGQTGSVVAKTLLEKDLPVRVIVRSEEKGKPWKDLGAEAAIADVRDADALTKAFEGGKVLYLMNPPHEQSEDMFVETEKVIKAFQTAIGNSSFKKLVALSSIGAHLPGNQQTSTNDNPLAMSDREDELINLLEKHHIDDDWRLAPILAETGVDIKRLEQITHVVRIEALKDVLTRLSVQITVSKLAGEIKNSVARISDLVGAIKEYSYMDQAAVQAIDLHKGLDNTLLILKHKLKTKNITVTREYDEKLPRVTAHGSLLNQVWTNLIDNAIDAMSDGGQLKIRTRLEPDDVLIEIRDNGAGIPPEAQPHIFEPFYTTKGVNEGTGLGLDAVSRIVRKHRGNIRFETKPGDTCFRVRMPLEQKPVITV